MSNEKYTINSKDVQLHETLLDALRSAYHNNKSVEIPADLLKDVLTQLEVLHHF